MTHLFMPLLLQRSPRTLPEPTEGLGYFFRGIDAQQETLAEIERLWELLLNSPLYHDVITVYAAWLAVACTFVFVALWLRNALKSNDIWQLEQLFWPIVVVGLLANHAALATTISVGLHDAANTFNRQVQVRIIAGENAVHLAQEAVLAQIQQDVYEQLYESCMQLPGAREARCKQSSRASARGRVREQRESDFEGLTLTGQLGGFLLREFFDLIRDSYLWLIEIGLLVLALTFPMSLAFALLPGPRNTAIQWFSSFVGHAFFGKLVFVVVTAIASHIYLNIPGIVSGYFLPFLLGPVAAIAGFYAGERSGTAIYGAIAGASVFTSVRGAYAAARGSVSVVKGRIIR
ncbi:MAG: hypothetical protein AAGC93_08600 [Cyanobacteria bacterium P01_F01_bin.53]